jgi:hypothetical protein
MSPIPLRPDPSAARAAALASLSRASLAIARAAMDKSVQASDLARRSWPNDRTAVEIVTRAASSPATLSNPTWAGALAATATAYLAALVPVSAGADLLQRGIQLSFDGSGKIVVPGIVMPGAGFVQAGAPIPVVAGTSKQQCELDPFKFAVITLLTGEMIRQQVAEPLIEQALVDASAVSLDSALFSTVAGVANQNPPGLLFGLTPLTPTAATGTKTEQMLDDLNALISAVVRGAGNSPIVLVAAPEQAISIKLLTPKDLEYPVLTSSALAAGTVIAIAVNALASAFAPTPAIDASQQAEIHRESVPGEIVDIGGIYARPVASMYQMDLVALRLRWPVSWGLRASNAVAFMTGVSW